MGLFKRSAPADAEEPDTDDEEQTDEDLEDEGTSAPKADEDSGDGEDEEDRGGESADDEQADYGEDCLLHAVREGPDGSDRQRKRNTIANDPECSSSKHGSQIQTGGRICVRLP